MENPFNLADDFIESYRFLVERHVAQEESGEFNAAARKQLLGFIGQEVRLNSAGFRAPAAMTETVASFVRVLDGRSDTLTLPEDAQLPRELRDEGWA